MNISTSVGCLTTTTALIIRSSIAAAAAAAASLNGDKADLLGAIYVTVLYARGVHQIP
jgi:hypothetical protein